MKDSTTRPLTAAAAEAERRYAEANPASRERYEAACAVMPQALPSVSSLPPLAHSGKTTTAYINPRHWIASSRRSSQ